MTRPTYNLICMTFDGDYITEKTGFDTVLDAWEHSEDMGSRWYFYPFHFVTTASGLTIADAPSLLDDMKGMRLKTVQSMFAEQSIFASDDCGIDEFTDMLRLGLSLMLER